MSRCFSMRKMRHVEIQAQQVLDGVLDINDCDDPYAVADLLDIEYDYYDPDNIRLIGCQDYNTSRIVNEGLPRVNGGGSVGSKSNSRSFETYLCYCCFFIFLLFIIAMAF